MMLLSNAGDYFQMLGLVALFGAIGGIAYELNPMRHRETGTLRVPHRIVKGRVFGLGVISSIVIGAIAAVAVLYFFPPETSITIQAANGASQTTTSYNLAKLIALAALVGAAGPSFLAAAQAKVLASLNEQKVQLVADLAKSEVERLGNVAQADVAHEVQSAVERHTPELAALVQQAALEMQAAVNKGTPADRLLEVLPANNGANQMTRISEKLTDMANDANKSVQRRLAEHINAAKKAITDAAKMPDAAS